MSPAGYWRLRSRSRGQVYTHVALTSSAHALPAAFRIRSAISCGCEMSETRLARYRRRAHALCHETLEIGIDRTTAPGRSGCDKVIASIRLQPLLCRFLDAGITSGASCSGVRRPKSARARSRGKFGRRAGGRRYGDLIVAPVMIVGAKVARGDLDRVGSGAWKRAIGISVVGWSVSTGDRLVDWRGCAEGDRRRRGASATVRESGCADRRSGS